MSVEIRTVRGPLDAAGVAALTELYGAVDAKYASVDYVLHQFVENPFGWAAHVFAVVDGRTVGHCGAIPFAARQDGKPFVAGKLEALAVESAHRGRRGDGGSVATDILTRLYPFAIESGMEVLFGLAPPPVARIHVRAGCHRVPTHAPAYTQVADASSFGLQQRSLRRRLGARVISTVQRGLLAATSPTAPADLVIRAPRADDVDLAELPPSEAGWTVAGADAWEWFAGSGVLHVLELDGRAGSRALARLDDTQPATVQIVSWQPRQVGMEPAFRLLRAAAALAREHRAPILRFQPWRGDASEAVLARACRLSAFVQRPEADLLLYPDSPRANGVRLTPFFYVTF